MCVFVTFQSAFQLHLQFIKMSSSSTLMTLSQHKSEIHAFDECILSLSGYNRTYVLSGAYIEVVM